MLVDSLFSALIKVILIIFIVPINLNSYLVATFPYPYRGTFQMGYVSRPFFHFDKKSLTIHQKGILMNKKQKYPYIVIQLQKYGIA